MKRYITYFIAVAAAAALTCSCIGNGVPDELENNGICLTVNAPDAAVDVKSSLSNGDDDFNENLLNSYYYFFYPQGSLDSAPVISGFVNGISVTEKHETTIPASANDINNLLFASSHECQMFIVANPPASLVSSLTASPTLSQLRTMVVLSNLVTVPQDNFVMIYDGLVELDSRSQETAVEVDVALSRLACKFTVGAYVTQSIEKDDKIYTPVTDKGGLTVSFSNALNRTTLSGYSKSVVSDADYFVSNDVELAYQSDELLDDGEHCYYQASEPVYSYSMEWEFASAKEPFLMYALEWKVTDKNTGDSDFKPLYYKLMLGRRSLAANEWYNISAKLDVLGSLFPEDPTVIYPNMFYQVLGWRDAFSSDSNPNTSADIKDTRYLVVPQSEWTLNNKNEIVIPFSSSHDCKILPGSIKATYTDFSSGEHVTKPHNPMSDIHITLDSQRSVKVEHTLNNNLGPGMDISPIDISFVLCHNDDETFYDTIKVRQYPAIYVETHANSAGPGTGSQTGNGKLGTVYINDAQSTASGDWRRIAGATSSGNNSSYFFTVITVTQFDASTGYVVGDPRKAEVDNLNVNNWNAHACENAPTRYTGDGNSNRKLMYYHPTIDDGSVDNFVAPKFRVNSAYCRSRQNNAYDDVKLRCASYQEDGYPAGRWRLPTLAECKLIQVLSGNGLVPNVFIQNGSSYYYAAGWWFTVSNTGVGSYHEGTSQNAAGRCVYDEWYWSEIDKEFGWDNSQILTQFTWGDIPENYVHNN